MNKILNFIKKLFNIKSSQTPDVVDKVHQFGVYAITTGVYVGEMWIMIDSRDGMYRFLSIPKNINRTAPIPKVASGIEEGIIEVVEDIPLEMQELIKEQFYHNDVNNKTN